jgi:putative acetyltransferase
MTHARDVVSIATARDLPRLHAVWEASVRATHDFLTETDIQNLIPAVKDALSAFPRLHCLRDDAGVAYAFLGVDGPMIEMLFIEPAERGRGAGRILTLYAIDILGATLVDVNEQNAQAVGFYQHLGFRPIDRSALDSAGRPFPIVHMALTPSV